MNPDLEHEKYYKNNSDGNHSFTPSPETLRFMQEQIQVNKDNLKDHAEIKTTLGRIEVKLDDIKVLDTKVNELDTWKKENSDFIDELKSERKDNHKRIVDLGWKIALIVLLVIFGLQNVESALKIFTR